MAGQKRTCRASRPPTLSPSQGTPSADSQSRAKATFRTPMSDSPATIADPPKIFALNRLRSHPAFRSAFTRRSIAVAPTLTREVRFSGASGSRMWFIPPSPCTGSQRQTATQEPSVVEITSASRRPIACSPWVM